MRTWGLIAAGAAAVVAVYGAPAGADTLTPGPGGGAYIDDHGSPTAEAHDGGTSPSEGAGGSSTDGGASPPCRWEVVVEDDSQMPIYDVDTLETLHSSTGRWLQFVCEGVGPVAVDGAFATPEGGLVDPAALAAEALASVEIGSPEVRTSPRAPELFVQMATWLGVDEGWWRPYEATASAGNVDVTVRAEPVSTTFDVGEGAVVRCDGGGAQWPERDIDCAHTYRSSHADLTITATVELEVSWVSNIGPGGDLDPITRTSSIDVTVGEIQGTGQN